MNRAYIPFYLSRGILSLAFSFLVFGLSWKALIISIFFFAGFLLYLHGGWFQVDLSNPIFPLRRDARGNEIQRKAIIASLIAGTAVFFFLTAVPLIASIPSITMAVCFLAYFGTQFLLFAAS